MAAGQILIPRPTGGAPIRASFAEAVVSGSLTFSQVADGRIQTTVPAGSAMSVGHSAPGYIAFDTGLTVADVLDRYIGVRLSSVDVPGGSGANVVLGVGLVYSGGVLSPVSDSYIWGKVAFGSQTDANQDVAVMTRKKANSLAIGDRVPNFTKADLAIRHHGVGDTRATFVMHTTAASQTNVRTTTDAQAEALTDKLYMIVFVGRSATTSGPSDVTFALDFLPPGVL